MVKITGIKKESPWYDDRKYFIGETFELNESRFTPISDKAKKFAEDQGVEYFVFIIGAEFENA